MKKMESSYILGTKINFGLDYSDVVTVIKECIQKNEKHIICTTNPEYIIQAQKDHELKSIIEESILSVPDGAGVLIAKRFIELTQNNSSFINVIMSGFKVGRDTFLHPEKIKSITGIDLIHHMCEMQDSNINFFLLGGWPKDFLGRRKKGSYDIAKLTSNVLKAKYPHIKIIGATSGFSPHIHDDEKVRAYINSSMTNSNVSTINILLVAYNNPQQEKWLARNLPHLNVNIGIGIGGSFDFIAGILPRAPYIVRKYHLEWLFRLLMQPYRLRRIINAVIVFPFFVLKSQIK